MKFSVVIPLYNEEKNIQPLIEEVIKALSKYKFKYELILVNDFSKDNTFNIIKAISNKYDFIKNISNKKNLGQSFSIIKGIKNSKYNTIVTLDGDGQNNPYDIPVLIDYYFKNKDIYLVGGLRKNRKEILIKKISSKIANKIRNFFLNDECEDTGCSLKVFDKDTFLKFPEFRGLHRFLPAFFKHHNKRMFFINVDHRRREEGKSNYGTIDRLVYGIVDLIRVFKIVNKIKND